VLAYQFMSAGYALDDLRKRRVKVSFLNDMNDPFELLGATLARAEHRVAFRKWRDHMNSISRALCFSRKWSNPVLWSHYADKHRGVALGFEIPDVCLLPISYKAARLELELEKNMLKTGKVDDDLGVKLLTTKFADWAYEDEVRMFLKPHETYEELGLHFYPFSSELTLKQVVIGARAAVSRKEVAAAIQPQDSDVEIISTRLAFKSFRIMRTPAK